MSTVLQFPLPAALFLVSKLLFFIFLLILSSYYLKTKEELQDGSLAGLVEELGQRVSLVHL